MRLYMNELTCASCHGYRLNPQALSVKVGGENGLNIGQVSDLSIADHLELLSHLTLTENEVAIAAPIIKEIRDRLTFLNNVGLNYLTLSRSAGTLSGGESQRIRFWQLRLAPTSVVFFISWMSPLLVYTSGITIA